MTATCPKRAARNRRICAGEYDEEKTKGAKTPLIAKQVLNYGGITSEAWAEALGVGTRRIQKWRVGEDEIPPGRQQEVIWKGWDLITTQSKIIETQINQWLIETYGPNAKDE